MNLSDTTKKQTDTYTLTHIIINLDNCFKEKAKGMREYITVICGLAIREGFSEEVIFGPERRCEG